MPELPQLYVIAGPNGAGKSSVASTFVTAGGVEVLDGDQILRDLYKYQLADPYTRAQEVLYERVAENLSAKKSFGFETNFHYSGVVEDSESIMQRAIRQGYSTNLVFIGLESPELALRRVEQRVKDGLHDVDSLTVRSRYEGGLQTLKQHFHRFDNAIVLDNSGETKTVLKAEKGLLTHLSDQVPDWVRQTLDEPIRHWQQDQFRGMKR